MENTNDKTFRTFDKRVREIEKTIELFVGTQLQRGTQKLRSLFTPRTVRVRTLTLDDIDIHADPIILEKLNSIDINITNKLSEINAEQANIIKRITILEETVGKVVSVIETDFVTHRNKFDKLYESLGSFNESLKELDSTKVDSIADEVFILSEKIKDLEVHTQEKLKQLEQSSILCLQ
jgi:hypothetical protein